MAWKNVQYDNGKYRTSEGGGGGASALTDLTDVNVSSPSDGQVLKYDSTTQKWKNENESGGGSVNDVTLDGNSVVNGQGTAVLTTPNVSGLKDTNISSPSSGQTLQYNATNQKWENVTPTSGGNVDDVKVNGTSVVANKVANITSYKEVTQAEYNALPDSKLNDGILYAIKDSAGADGFPPLIYSLEEREVGVWIDGRPLYQKVITFSQISNSPSKRWYNVADVSSLSINHLVTCVLYNNYQPWYEYYSAVSNGYLRIYSANDSWGADVALIQYTKTTDTPGSGTWNTDGTYAHHYSTSEKVIGTWIDGKPLYEKSFQFSNYVSLSTKTWTTVMDVSSLSISKLVRCDFIDMEGVYWSGALNRISNGNLQSYVFEGWPVKELTLQYTKTTD